MASPPRMISGARLTVSATEFAVMTSTINTLMTLEKVERPLETRWTPYHRIKASDA
ncbi:hypothetical protein HanXRQr2_Chr15g0710861 [Helianthus annuus]|uniref:Uncharacterized protein n=1 Tax=Helianthus annuus TaxID=4232 RepID=A0A9K3E476_HELAN|nr:hypothetical protein HanXRQr2_Chr15g0710861 [Helianthus annuus]KAJ0832742.1 hypothetical protein HanPSC8_Chr15g0682211 [Helianthus annuus]